MSSDPPPSPRQSRDARADERRAPHAADHFASLAADWHDGRWHADLPERALALAQRAPRLQNRLLAIDIAHLLRCTDVDALQRVRRALALDTEPHPRLLLRTAAIALELGDRQAALADLDHAYRLENGALRARLAKRLPGGSLWRASACPALLVTLLEARPDRLTSAERALAERAARWMDKVCTSEALIDRQLALPMASLPQAVPRIRNQRPRVAMIDSELPVDDGALGEPVTGMRIDAADLVVRFDRTDVHPGDCQQRGMRTDIWVWSSASPPSADEPAGSSVLIAEPSFAYRPQPAWTRIDPDDVQVIAGLDGNGYRTLVGTLASRPSAALATLMQLAAHPRNLQIELVDRGRALAVENVRTDRNDPTARPAADVLDDTDPERALLLRLLSRHAS